MNGLRERLASINEGKIMCTQAQLKRITSEVSHSVKKALGDRLHNIILYGSYARGDYNDGSDIDIMVLADVKDEEKPAFLKVVDKISSNISLKNDITVSILLKDKNFFNAHTSVLPFYRNVEVEGVEVYAAQ